MIRARLNIAEFSAMAFISSRRPTISTTNACRDGASKAFAVPSRNARIATCHHWMVPRNMSAANMKARVIMTVWVISSSRRLGMRSATTPAQREKASTGTPEQNATTPSLKGEWVSS